MRVFSIPSSVLSLPKCERLPCLGFFQLLASCYEAKSEIPICLCVVAWNIHWHCAVGNKDTRHWFWKMDDRALDGWDRSRRQSARDQGESAFRRRPGERVCGGCLSRSNRTITCGATCISRQRRPSRGFGSAVGVAAGWM